ncbi:MAG TPA: PA14 domain-containing protein [Candidatus Hydrogenedentes bacterium]|nr:PA14 domain-containing protein [Candidatus Hydrogenedentota bacterium]HOS03536.1 PA14 domain-containing protein [Candidatus Hydrogenedentota bacterium]
MSHEKREAIACGATVAKIAWTAAWLLSVAAHAGEQPARAMDGWDFRAKEFIIAAFNPPPATDVDYALYREAGFNLVMSPRYQDPQTALDLAQKHGLMVLVDTYTPNGNPWGGVEGEYAPHPFHHPATLPELQWLHARYGKHPALAGFLLGDDIGMAPPPLVATTNWMRQNCPDLFPWICQCYFHPESLAQVGAPIANPQFYPTLYNARRSAAKQAEIYCNQLLALRDAAVQYGLLPWPMFNVATLDLDRPFTSASLVRFQVYASLAYGAQGIWYFTYQDFGALATKPVAPNMTIDEARDQLDPKWRVAKDANLRVQAWGPKLIGRTCEIVYHSGAWPKKPTPVEFERVDKTLFFNWEYESPFPEMDIDHFEVVWTGCIKAKSFDPITFNAVSNNGCRVWIDGKKIIDNWDYSDGAFQASATVTLPMGKLVPIRVEYYERDNEAAMMLEWFADSFPKEATPSDNLFTDETERETGLVGRYRTTQPPPLYDRSGRPGRGEWVTRMSDDLLVGILAKPGEAPLAMIVDKRVERGPDTLSARTVRVTFKRDVSAITLFDGASPRTIKGRTVITALPPGGGQLVQLAMSP